MTKGALSLKVWGASGSTTVGSGDRAQFGGDTVCFEVRAGDRSVILDLGTGARRLGARIRADRPAAPAGAAAPEYDVLLSHLHLDHVIGLPFFAPLYMPDAAVRLHCGMMSDPLDLLQALRRIASPPLSPIEPLSIGRVSCHTFAPDAVFVLGGIQVTAIATHHPGGCCGFRFDTEAGSIAVIGDHEHGEEAVDARVRAAIEGVDLLLYDGCYDVEQYDQHRGWGHSTWAKGIEFAQDAGARSVLIYHHPPEATDASLLRLEEKLQARFPGAAYARQEMTATVANGQVALDFPAVTR